MSFSKKAFAGLVVSTAASFVLAVGSAGIASADEPSVTISQSCTEQGVAVVSAYTTVVATDDYALAKVNGDFTVGEGTLDEVNAWLAEQTFAVGDLISVGVNAYETRAPEGLLWSASTAVTACTTTPIVTPVPTPIVTPAPAVTTPVKVANATKGAATGLDGNDSTASIVWLVIGLAGLSGVVLAVRRRIQRGDV